MYATLSFGIEDLRALDSVRVIASRDLSPIRRHVVLDIPTGVLGVGGKSSVEVR